MNLYAICVLAVYSFANACEIFNQERHSVLPLLSYLQRESALVSISQLSIKSFLNSKHISVESVNTTQVKSNSNKKRRRYLIALSSKSNNIECRVSLEKAPIGTKCVAPCGCSGSQKWIQFSILNKLRRKDPDQWNICRTCQQKLNYNFVSTYGGVKGNLLTVLLDKPQILRTMIVLFAVVTAFIVKLQKKVIRILVSKYFWQAYNRWSKLTHLPFVFLIWGAKLILQFLLNLYYVYEKELLMLLTQVESAIVEPRLPVTVTDNDI